MSERPASEAIDPRAVQGLVARGYGALHHAAFLVLGIDDIAHARAWVGVLAVTSGVDAADAAAMNLAFTYRGLQALGLDAAAMEGFGDELREGMVSEHRRRLLGDHGDSAPEHWDWGGARPELGIADVEADEIDALLLLYAATAEQLEAMIELARREQGKRGVTVRTVLRGSWLADSKEHFGFADGIAQPGVRGLRGDGPGAEANIIAPGEILLGYPNEYGRLPLSPQVAAASALLPGGDGQPGHDFGRDGSYLVVRQLEQDVPGFWRWVTEAAERTGVGEVFGRDQDPRIRLASKMVGRWPSGAPLALCPHRDDAALGAADDFGYARDPLGLACPLGAHVRRTNPRDWLLGDSPEEAARNARRHRLLRRGRTYGPPLVDSMDTLAIAQHPGDGVPRGLLFACLNADIGRQFELVQQTWVNNPKFASLHDDADPILGDHAPTASRSRAAAADPAFTLPAAPVRIRASGLPRFVRVRGGAYFFLPSMRALAYLAALTG